LRVIRETERLPPLRDLKTGVLRNPASTTTPVDRLDDFLRRDLSQVS